MLSFDVVWPSSTMNRFRAATALCTANSLATSFHRWRQSAPLYIRSSGVQRASTNPNQLHLQVAEVDHLHAARQGHPEVRRAHVHPRRADVHRRLLDLGADGHVLAAEGHASPVAALKQGPRGGPEPFRQPSALAGDLWLVGLWVHRHHIVCRFARSGRIRSLLFNNFSALSSVLVRPQTKMRPRWPV